MMNAKMPRFPRRRSGMTPEQWVEQGRSEMGPYTQKDLDLLRQLIDYTPELSERTFYLRVYALIKKEIG